MQNFELSPERENLKEFHDERSRPSAEEIDAQIENVYSLLYDNQNPKDTSRRSLVRLGLCSP